MGRNKCQNSGTRGRHTRREININPRWGQENLTALLLEDLVIHPKVSTRTIQLIHPEGKGESPCPREERTSKSNLLLAKYGQTQTNNSIAQSEIENITSVVKNSNNPVNMFNPEVQEMFEDIAMQYLVWS